MPHPDDNGSAILQMFYALREGAGGGIQTVFWKKIDFEI